MLGAVGVLAVMAAVGAQAGRSADRPVVTFGDRAIVVLEAPSVAEQFAGAATTPSAGTQRGWSAEVEASQQLLLSAMSERGIQIQRDFVYRITLNGFSAQLTPRARALLEQTPGVRGVYPVRAVYPSDVTGLPVAGPGDIASKPEGLAGEGVTVALLSTGLVHEHPALRGRVLPGVDVFSGQRQAVAATQPGGDTIEVHGTEMAGIILGSGTGAEPGIAPGARVLPIRVVGWHKVADGSFSVVGRGDQLIAGFERAADPNGDGALGDRVQIALAPVVEPYASFANSPESMAVAGATSLGILVVAASGDDGSAGAEYGSVGGPGGSPMALTVGAAEYEIKSGGLFLESEGGRVVRRLTGAGFSSAGLAFGGRVKPDVVAPGVAIPTVSPGAESPVVVSGSGAAAAVVAGQAAVLIEAQPSLRGSALKDVLVGSAKPLSRSAPVFATGAGSVSVPRSLNLKLTSSPSSVSLKAGKAELITVRNVSAKRRSFTIDVVGEGARVIRARPSKLVLAPGQQAAVRIRARGANRLTAPVAAVIAVKPGAGSATRIPVAVIPSQSQQKSLVGAVSLERKALIAGAGERLRVSFRAGAIGRTASEGLSPVEVLDVQLLRRNGKSLGRLLRLHQLLPGQYTIALTGRAPDGAKLAPGRYILRLKAAPVGDGNASTAQVRFRVVAPNS